MAKNKLRYRYKETEKEFSVEFEIWLINVTKR